MAIVDVSPSFLRDEPLKLYCYDSECFFFSELCSKPLVFLSSLDI